MGKHSFHDIVKMCFLATCDGIVRFHVSNAINEFHKLFLHVVLLAEVIKFLHT